MCKHGLNKKVQKIRILEAGVSCHLGGVETFIISVYRNMDRKFFTMDFVYTLKGQANEMVFYDEIIANGDNVYAAHDRQSWKTILQSNRYDVVICNFSDLFYLTPFIVSKQYKVPQIIFHSHSSGSDYAKWKLRLTTPYWRYVQRKLDIWGITQWACSESAARWIFGPQHHSLIIRDGIITDNFQFNPSFRSNIRETLGIGDDLLIGHIGRFVPMKNQLFLLEIFLETLKLIPNAHLILIGETGNDYYKKVFAKVEELRITENVHFTGLSSNVIEYYSAMDCFVLPSIYEGFGIVGVEAQASGLPCLLSDTTPVELAMTTFAHRCSLSEPAAIWASRVQQICTDSQDRNEGVKQVKKAGFDLIETIHQIENVLLKNK